MISAPVSGINTVQTTDATALAQLQTCYRCVEMHNIILTADKTDDSCEGVKKSAACQLSLRDVVEDFAKLKVRGEHL